MAGPNSLRKHMYVGSIKYIYYNIISIYVYIYKDIFVIRIVVCITVGLNGDLDFRNELAKLTIKFKRHQMALKALIKIFRFS